MNVMFQNIAMVLLSFVSQMFLFRMDIPARITKLIVTMACANTMMRSVKSSLAQVRYFYLKLIALILFIYLLKMEVKHY